MQIIRDDEASWCASGGINAIPTSAPGFAAVGPASPILVFKNRPVLCAVARHAGSHVGRCVKDTGRPLPFEKRKANLARLLARTKRWSEVGESFRRKRSQPREHPAHLRNLHRPFPVAVGTPRALSALAMSFSDVTPPPAALASACFLRASKAALRTLTPRSPSSFGLRVMLAASPTPAAPAKLAKSRGRSVWGCLAHSTRQRSPATTLCRPPAARQSWTPVRMPARRRAQYGPCGRPRRSLCPMIATAVVIKRKSPRAGRGKSECLARGS
jgi:hypothetical protein